MVQFIQFSPFKSDLGYRKEKSFRQGMFFGLPPTNWQVPGAIPVPAEAISRALEKIAEFHF